MAVCVPAESYGDFDSCFGACYPDGAEMQVVTVAAVTSPNGHWSPSNADGIPMAFWQEQPVIDHPTNGSGVSGEWPGGVSGGWTSGSIEASMPNNGWVAAGNPSFLPPHGIEVPNGYGGNTAQHAARPKRRFCTSYPEVQHCRRGSSCAFAHSRQEICAPLLQESEEMQDKSFMTDEFFMYKYKTMWCPIGVQHEWHTCVYAHNYQDARRPVSTGYGARLCPYWSKKDTGAEYSQRCPLGLRCPYSHGAKEQLYHPQYFKTVICRDLKGKACPRQGLCAFFHHRSERRSVHQADEMDYSQPLNDEEFDNDWITEFLSPPFLPETKGNEEGQMDGSSMAVASYSSAQASQASYGMQQMPVVFLCPMPQMSNAQMSDIGSAMASQMGNQMASPTGNWVFVPVEQQQVA
jgi:hypothetical protein